MTPKTLLASLTLAASSLLFAASSYAQTKADSSLPHLEKRGNVTQLIVDGQPWLIRGGEIANTASSDLNYMKAVWPKMARLNLNTVLVGVAWDWIEPTEGKYDFALVDGLLEGARANNLRVVFLWFGSWKNGLSSFAPAWVKADQKRFPRARLKSGKAVEVLTPLNQTNRDADTKAYVAFMKHLREVDAKKHTVLMIQMENEVGLIGDSRDRGPEADDEFGKAVPNELGEYLQKNKATLLPEIASIWNEAGAKPTGTWAEMFGATPAADEIFMAWHYARYMDHLAEKGKAEHAIPVFTNTWIVQPEDKGPGDYPSGGPEPRTLEIWRAGAPHIDLNCPDIYLPNFTEWVSRFHRNGNPLFVPESRGDAGGVANAFYAIGQHASLGYSPFGIDNTGRLLVLRPEPGSTAPTELENLPLTKGYELLRDLTPLILEHQAKGTIGAASLDPKHQNEDLALGDYTVKVDLRRNFRNKAQIPPLGYAMVFALGPDEYLVAGCDVQVTFSPKTPGPGIAGLALVETGKYVNGRWTPNRRLNGDDVLLNYDQAAAAAENQSGSGLRFGPEGPTLQRVKLYRYQ